MRKDDQKMAVHCFFTDEGENLQKLISQSLWLFIERNLQNFIAF